MSSSPRRASIEWSPTEGVTPKPTKLIEQVFMLIYMVPETASWNSLAENNVDPTTHMGSCTSANFGGTPIATWGESSPCGDLAISANPGGVFAIGYWSPPAVTLPSGLGQVMDLPPGQWPWVSNALCHRLPWMYLLAKPYNSCCGFVPERMGDLQPPMSRRTWSWPNEGVGHPLEPQHQWMWVKVPWLTGAPAHSLPVGKACPAVGAGPFLANICQGLLGLLHVVILSTKPHIGKV